MKHVQRAARRRSSISTWRGSADLHRQARALADVAEGGAVL